MEKQALTEPIELYPHSNVSVYNCSNCSYINECKAIRKESGEWNSLKNYFCFDHSHFDE